MSVLDGVHRYQPRHKRRVVVQNALQGPQSRHRDIGPALDLYNHALKRLGMGYGKVNPTVHPAIGGPLRSNEALYLFHGPLLEMVLVLLPKVLRSLYGARDTFYAEVLSLYQPQPLGEAYTGYTLDGVNRYIYPYPLSLQLVRRLNSGRTAAEWVKYHVSRVID